MPCELVQFLNNIDLIQFDLVDYDIIYLILVQVLCVGSRGKLILVARRVPNQMSPNIKLVNCFDPDLCRVILCLSGRVGDADSWNRYYEVTFPV